MTTTELKALLKNIRGVLGRAEQCADDDELDGTAIDHYDCVADLKTIVSLIAEAEGATI